MNRAKADQRLFNELLNYFVMERFLYRLGTSPYARRFVLKGALMFSVWQGPFTRPTRDIDLAGRMANSAEELVATIKTIGQTLAPVDDGLEFLPETVSGEPIIAGADYEGARVSVIARLGNARIPFHVDIGFGDLIYPAATSVQLPALLDFPLPVLQGYSRESVIAEKYQAMVHRSFLWLVQILQSVWQTRCSGRPGVSAICRSLKPSFTYSRRSISGQSRCRSWFAPIVQIKMPHASGA